MLWGSKTAVAWPVLVGAAQVEMVSTVVVVMVKTWAGWVSVRTLVLT